MVYLIVLMIVERSLGSWTALGWTDDVQEATECG